MIYFFLYINILQLQLNHISMSQFSQTAIPYNIITKMTEDKSPPTKPSIAMANAFIQIFKYNEGPRNKIVYDPADILYYSLFIDDYSNTIKHMSEFIHQNKHVLIEYLQNHYSLEYQQRDTFTKTLQKWNDCSTSEIIYALSTEHSNCLYVLDYCGDKSPTTKEHTSIMWVTYMSDFSSSEPCDPLESSAINEIKIDMPIHSSQEYSTPADVWTYAHNLVIGGGDY